MKIVGFEVNGEARLGALESEEIVDLTAADKKLVPNLAEVLAQSGGDLSFLAEVAKTSNLRHPRGQVKFTLPVTHPGKIICLGLNYIEHAKEGGHTMPQAP